MLAKGRIEVYRFEGAKAMNGTVDAAAVVDKTSTYPDLGRGIGVVDITDTAHGYLAGDREDIPNFIFLQGTTYFDGLRRIHSVPDVNSLFIYANYTAETLANTDIIRPALQFNEDWLFRGFKLHLGAASATTENLVISVDADAGSSFDFNILTRDMNGVQDLGKFYTDEPIFINKKDILYVTWANSNSETWGLELHAQRLA